MSFDIILSTLKSKEPGVVRRFLKAGATWPRDPVKPPLVGSECAQDLLTFRNQRPERFLVPQTPTFSAERWPAQAWQGRVCFRLLPGSLPITLQRSACGGWKMLASVENLNLLIFRTKRQTCPLFLD